MVSPEADEAALASVDAVAAAVGPKVGLMIEFHGRLGAGESIRFIRKLEPCNIVWCEEPVAPEALDLLFEVKRSSARPIASGERLYTLSEFHRLASLRACDVVQMDIGHCGGLSAAKKVAAMAAVQDIGVSPHCSIGPVALAAAIHFAYATPNMLLQECFSEFDVDWRRDLVGGWDPLDRATLALSEKPGLGIELDLAAIADHPYRALSFPSLWDGDWVTDFTGATDPGSGPA